MNMFNKILFFLCLSCFGVDCMCGICKKRVHVPEWQDCHKQKHYNTNVIMNVVGFVDLSYITKDWRHEYIGNIKDESGICIVFNESVIDRILNDDMTVFDDDKAEYVNNLYKTLFIGKSKERKNNIIDQIKSFVICDCDYGFKRIYFSCARMLITISRGVQESVVLQEDKAKFDQYAKGDKLALAYYIMHKMSEQIDSNGYIPFPIPFTIFVALNGTDAMAINVRYFNYSNMILRDGGANNNICLPKGYYVNPPSAKHIVWGNTLCSQDKLVEFVYVHDKDSHDRLCKLVSAQKDEAQSQLPVNTDHLLERKRDGYNIYYKEKYIVARVRELMGSNDYVC